MSLHKFFCVCVFVIMLLDQQAPKTAGTNTAHPSESFPDAVAIEIWSTGTRCNLRKHLHEFLEKTATTELQTHQGNMLRSTKIGFFI
uniref:Putative secreted protein n=1 Tax=Rhipicephalus microplus TaxID=6941 RepID=A0A6M2DAG9_RHIMP